MYDGDKAVLTMVQYMNAGSGRSLVRLCVQG